MNRIVIFFICIAASWAVQSTEVRLKDIARIDGMRENSITGFGLVVGLSGTGDSGRSGATMQTIMNTLANFDVIVSPDDINSRNVATVIVTAELPAFAQSGDRLNVNVSSLGDARSLVGGTLLLSPLEAANGEVYALAQGQVSVGGFKYDLNGNVVQKNHPTVGVIPDGATVERNVASALVSEEGELHLILNSADFTTTGRIKRAINEVLGEGQARSVHPGRIAVNVPPNADVVELAMQLEGLKVVPDRLAKVVINERTGTVVSGGDVRIEDVTISHGDIKLVISTEFAASQPTGFVSFLPNVSTVVVPNTDIEVEEEPASAVSLPAGTSIADLIASLKQIKTSTRDIITILQAIRTAGALHAQLIIQ